MPTLQKTVIACATVVLGLLVPGFGLAAPYTPAQRDVVVETLPAIDPAVSEQVQTLHRRLAAAPQSVALATELARHYIDLSRQTDDTRYNGYAQAALRPWWEQPQPPTEVLMLRAHLLQNRHAFDQARSDLQQVLERDPRRAQAWLELAAIERVTGSLGNAHKACAALLTLASTLISGTCLADIASLTGKGQGAYATLDRLLQTASADAAPGLRRWALTIQGEIAWRLGQPALALQALEAALELAEEEGVFDGYLLGLWSDFMLARGQARPVRKRLAPYAHSDALLLRYVIASKRLMADDAIAMADVLRRRFEASQRRGDTVHQREQARFALDVDEQPAEALWLAQHNWAVQKEPADLLLLLRAALAFNPAAAAPARAYLASTGLEDVRAEALIERLDQLDAAA